MHRRFTKKQVVQIEIASKNNVSQNAQDNSTIIFGILLVTRLVNVLLVKTWFVPDEYWQSLEVAHKLTFGYGYLTWEWKEGIRSYLHPIIFSIVYYFIEICGLSYFVDIVVYGPRVMEALFSALAELCFYKFLCRSYNKQVATWSLFSLSTSWFWWFCATRTLVNSFESVLICFSLYFFKWKEAILCKNYVKFIFITSIAISIRLTCLSILVPLYFLFIYRYFLLNSYYDIMIIVLKSALTILSFLLVPLIIDCICYSRLVFIHYNFVTFNLLNNQGTFYGSHPWHWYLTQGIPVVLGSHLPIIFYGIKLHFNKTTINKYKNQQQLTTCFLFIIFLTVGLYSLPGHKEFRFILSILPFFMVFSGIALNSMSANFRNIAILYLLVTNAVTMLYTGLAHQSAPLDIMNYIRHNVPINNDNLSKYDVLFLLPCHSTPYYSHIHQNLSLRFLTCEPNLLGNKSGYIDEADKFYNDPHLWLNENLFYQQGSICPGDLPNYIVAYNVLVNKYYPLLRSCYNVVHESFHTHFPEGRIGSAMLVLKRF